MCVEVHISDEIEQEQLARADMPAAAEGDYAPYRAIGDEWYDRGESAVLWVPSVVSPYESNLLFNQRHGDFSRIRVGEPQPVSVDPRLWHQHRS